MDDKTKQFKSETVLFFAATALASVITELAANAEFKQALGDNATMIIFGMSIIGYVLRKYTTKPLEPIFKKKPKEEIDPIAEAFKEDDRDMYN